MTEPRTPLQQLSDAIAELRAEVLDLAEDLRAERQAEAYRHAALEGLRLRREKGLTQRDLADEVGVTIRTVRRWEAGKSRPRDRHLLRLAALFERVEATATLT